MGNEVPKKRAANASRLFRRANNGHRAGREEYVERVSASAQDVMRGFEANGRFRFQHAESLEGTSIRAFWSFSISQADKRAVVSVTSSGDSDHGLESVKPNLESSNTVLRRKEYVKLPLYRKDSEENLLRQDMEEIGNLLPSIFQRQAWRGDPRLAEVLARLWPRVAGRAVAEHSRPTAFADGTLTLETDDRCWARQLQALSKEIQVQVNQFLGRAVVRQVKVHASRRGWLEQDSFTLRKDL